MKFTTVIAILAAAASVESKPYSETNAYRLARGLPLHPPVRRTTPVAGARRSETSGSSTPNACSTYILCCDLTVTTGGSCSFLSFGVAAGYHYPSCNSQQLVCCGSYDTTHESASGCSSLGTH